MASSTPASQPPRLPIEASMRGRSQLALDYWGFLSSVDPIERWEDITALKEPVATNKNYPDLLEKERILRDYYPSLLHQVITARDWGEMARHLGFRYAWTRLLMHAAILDVISDYCSDTSPSLIVEPGCFCSGLIHYAPEALSVEYMGFDLSPVALDVCRALATKHGIGDRVRLHSGNFLQLTTEQFARTTSHSIDYIWTLFSPPQLSGFVKQVGFDGGIPDGTVWMCIGPLIPLPCGNESDKRNGSLARGAVEVERLATDSFVQPTSMLCALDLLVPR